MKTAVKFGGLAVVGTVAAAALMTGCGGQESPPTDAPPEVAAKSGGSASNAMSANVAAAMPALGSQQAVGPFQVTLSTAATPKAGDTSFQAKVARDGKPVPNAIVKLSLSMPSMNMAGPEVVLKPVAGGVYSGIANLSMAADWAARVTVASGTDSGTVTYTFTVK